MWTAQQAEGDDCGSFLVSVTGCVCREEQRPSLDSDWLKLQASSKERRSLRVCLHPEVRVSKRLALPPPCFYLYFLILQASSSLFLFIHHADGLGARVSSHESFSSDDFKVRD